MEKRDIKAIFFDIDGTLVNQKHEISESTLKSLQKLKQKGIKIVVATGRPHLFAEKFLKTLPIEFDAKIMMNGQYCLCNNKLILERFISKKTIRKALDYFEENNIGTIIATNKGTFVNLDENHLPEELMLVAKRENHVFFDMSKFDDYTYYQIMPRIHKNNIILEKQVLTLMEGCKGLRWGEGSMDIVLEDSGKKSGIDAVLEYYDIPLENTMAFGDGENDMDMLENVSIGIAMGNAMEEVKRVADYITDSVEEEGIYNALKYFDVL